MEQINLSVEPIQIILEQLGATIAAQISAANDRAEAAETEFARWQTALRSLIGEMPRKEPLAAANDALDVPAPEVAPVATNVRTGIADQVFLDALTAEWQSAHAIRKALIVSDHGVAFGTVYKRMEKLTATFPDRIEATVEPARWRLRAPNSSEKIGADNLVTLSRPVKSSKPGQKQKKSLPLPVPANDMPPSVITDVRARIVGEPAPAETFAPDLRHADCFEVMKSMADGSVDLILADPPYNTTGLDIDPKIDLTALWTEFRRIVKPTGTIILFGSQPFTSRLVCEASDLFKYDLVWLKNRATQAFQARNLPLKQHEDILVFSLGTTISANRTNRRYTYNALGQRSAGMLVVSKGKHSAYLRNIKHNPGRQYEGTTNNPRSTLYCPKDKRGLHPFQKPLPLLEYLIRTYSNEGEIVFDPFVGSGSTCVAALQTGRRSIGVEATRKYSAIAEHRVAAAMLPKAT